MMEFMHNGRTATVSDGTVGEARGLTLRYLLKFQSGQPVRVTRAYAERPSSGIGWDPGFALPGTVWIVKDHRDGFNVRCWRTYDWFRGDEIVESYEEADVPPSALEHVTGGERQDDS